MKSATDLVQREFLTRFKIQTGFYLHRDFFMVISKDKSCHEYLLELFSFDHHGKDGVKHTIDMMGLFRSDQNIDIQVALDCKRLFAVIYCQLFKSDNTLVDQKLVIIDAQKLMQRYN